MIDGPHRSLPLQGHWKKFALHVDKRVYSLEERCQFLSVAVKKEFSSSVLIAAHSVLDEIGRGLPNIFNSVERIEVIRKDCPGSIGNNLFIDCVVCELLEGGTGRKVIRDALKKASEEITHINLRSIEEHYCREEENMRTINSLRGRMDETVEEINFDSVASELIENLESRKKVQEPSKRVGIEEGPEL
jgi:hypothetical protein